MILNGALRSDVSMLRDNKFDLFIGDDVYSKNKRIADILLKLKKDLLR